MHPHTYLHFIVIHCMVIETNGEGLISQHFYGF